MLTRVRNALCAQWPRRFLPAGLIIALLCAFLAGPASSLTEDRRTQGLLATVKIYIINGNEKVIGGCSGTVVEPAGFILTNFHCVGRAAYYEPDDTEARMSIGQTYHPQGIVVIAPTKDARTAPVPTYRAQVVAGTPEHDVAVLKIIGPLKSQDRLPSPLQLIAVPSGDSSRMNLGDRIHVFGFPGIGGELITYTDGIVSGFDDHNDDGVSDAIKTTADFSPGNSGGLAMNDTGDQIGIPTYSVERAGARLNRLMEVNIAKEHIEGGVTGTGKIVLPTPSSGLDRSGATPVPSPTVPGPRATPSTPPSGRTTTVRGTVLDQDTRRPIAGAVIGLLKPGISAAESRRREFPVDDIETLAETDQRGMYQMERAVSTGQTYSVVAGASGYQPRDFERGLAIRADAPSVYELEPITLRKR